MRLTQAASPCPVSAVLRAGHILVWSILVWSALLLAGYTSVWAAPSVALRPGASPLAVPRPGASPAKPRLIFKGLSAVPPAAPSSLALDTYPTPTSIELYWTSNSTNENSFSVERKVDGQPDSAFTPVGSADPVDSVGAQVFFTDPSGLDFDTVYDYRVRAIAADGTPSDYSNTATGTTAPAKPISVSVAAVAGSDSKLALSWVDNARHTYYFRLWRKGPGETAFTLFGYWGGPEGGGSTGKGVAFTYTDTGLTVSSAYSYYITAYNPAGQSDPSDTVVGTTNTTQAAPVAPSMNAYAGSSGADGKADPRTTIEAYFYDRSTNAATVTMQRLNADDPAGVYANFPGYPKPITGGVNTLYDNYDTGLDVDTAYSYRAYASNSKGDSPYSNIATAATVPVKPITVQAAPLSDTKIKLSWVDNARHTYYFRLWRKGPGETAFTLFGYWGGPEGGGSTGKGVAFTYTDTGLTVSSAYSYYITAYNPAGQSDPSDTVTATTFPANPPGAPTDLRAAGGSIPARST